MFPCLEPGCHALAEPDGEPRSFSSYTHLGEGLAWVQWIRCLAGHRYMVEVPTP